MGKNMCTFNQMLQLIMADTYKELPPSGTSASGEVEIFMMEDLRVSGKEVLLEYTKHSCFQHRSVYMCV